MLLLIWLGDQLVHCLVFQSVHGSRRYVLRQHQRANPVLFWCQGWKVCFEDVAVRECTDARESVRMQIDWPTGLVERRKEHDSLMAMSSAWKTELL